MAIKTQTFLLFPKLFLQSMNIYLGLFGFTLAVLEEVLMAPHTNTNAHTSREKSFNFCLTISGKLSRVNETVNNEDVDARLKSTQQAR